MNKRISGFIFGAALALCVGVASGATFNLFSPASGVLKGNPNTYVTTAATASDITGLFTVCTSSVFLRGDGICSTINLGSGNVTGITAASNGGTGVSTLTGIAKGNGTAAFSTALAADIIGLWSGTCSVTTFLRGDGTCTVAGSGGTPGGSTTQVQYNNAGAFAGDAGFTYDAALNIITLGETGTAGTIKPPDNGAGAGTSITMKGGDSTSGNGSSVFITGGSRTGATTTPLTRGRVIISGGPGGTTGGAGGLVSLAGGAPATGFNGAGGGVSVNGTSGDGTGAGGGVTFVSGNGGTTGTAGDISFLTGSGGVTSGDSGKIIFSTGLVTSGTVGYVDFVTNSISRLRIMGDGSWTVNSSVGTSGYPLLSGGAGTTPSWGQLDLSTAATGTLAVTHGGSGVATLTGPLKGNGASAFSAAVAADIVGLFSSCSGTQYLGADGACHNGGSGSPAGIDTQVQFNDGGSFGADTGFSYNKTSNTLDVPVITQNGNQVLDTGQNSQTIFFTANSNGNGLSMINGSTGAAATNTLDVANSSNTLHMTLAGTGHTGTLITGGVSGQSAAIYTQGAVPMDIGTNSVSQLRLTSGGGLQVGVPTGGDKGVGTLNATGLYINGSSVAAGPGGSTTQVQFNAAGAFSGDAAFTFNSGTGAVVATSFSGSGAALTALNAGNISTGTLAVARGGTGTTTSTGTGNVVLSASPTLTGTVTATTIAATTVTVGGNSVCQSTGTNCPSATAGGSTTQVQYNSTGVLAGSASFTFDSGTGAVSATSFTGSGATLTSLNAGNISAGTLPVNRGGTGTTTSTGTGNVVLSASPTITGTLTAATVAATTLTGAGSGITSLDAGNVSAGTLAVARGGTGTTTSTGTGNVVLSASPTFTGTITGGTFSGTHTGDGSALTALNGSNVASGTVAAARVANIDLAATGNGGITGTLPVSHGGTGVTTSTGTGNAVLSASPTLTGTVTAATIAATSVTVGGNSLCQSTGTNCPSSVIPKAAFGRFTFGGGSCAVVAGSGSNISSCSVTADIATITFGQAAANGWACTAVNTGSGALIPHVALASTTSNQVFFQNLSSTVVESDFHLTCMAN